MVRAFSVNFCQKEKRQNVRPQRMFLFYISLNAGACTAWIGTKNSRSGCKYYCAQSMLETIAKAVHSKKMCLFARNRPSVQSRVIEKFSTFVYVSRRLVGHKNRVKTFANTCTKLQSNRTNEKHAKIDPLDFHWLSLKIDL